MPGQLKQHSHTSTRKGVRCRTFHWLVSSGIHLRRSVLYFTHFGVAAQPVRADYVSAMMSPIPLSYNFLVADLALHEYAGVVRYFVYQRMGWNVRAKRPGAL